MGSKLNPGKFDCYTNALPDEPMFVLLARDPYAPGIVRAWARSRELGNRAQLNPTSEAKIAEARQCADDMTTWRDANPKPEGGYPVPLPTNGLLQFVTYMRDAQPEAEDAAYVPCAKGDPGAFPVYR